MNPVSTLIPGSGSDPAKALDERISEIRKLQGDSSSDYWRGPKAESLQGEYLQLLQAKEKQNSRAAA